MRILQIMPPPIAISAVYLQVGNSSYRFVTVPVQCLALIEYKPDPNGALETEVMPMVHIPEQGIAPCLDDEDLGHYLGILNPGENPKDIYKDLADHVFSAIMTEDKATAN